MQKLNLSTSHEIVIKTFIELPVNTYAAFNYIQWENTKEIGDIFWAHKEPIVKYEHKMN